MTSKQIEIIEIATKYLFLFSTYKVFLHKEGGWEFVFYKPNGQLIGKFFVENGLFNGKLEITTDNVKLGLFSDMMILSVVKK